jgi:hypothetical protein
MDTGHSSREATPEPSIIPSQHRLQQLLELGVEELGDIPDHVIYQYQSRGLVFKNEEGTLVLASPVKTRPS